MKEYEKCFFNGENKALLEALQKNGKHSKIGPWAGVWLIPRVKPNFFLFQRVQK